jgi:hypothetical protein
LHCHCHPPATPSTVYPHSQTLTDILQPCLASDDRYSNVPLPSLRTRWTTDATTSPEQRPSLRSPYTPASRGTSPRVYNRTKGSQGVSLARRSKKGGDYTFDAEVWVRHGHHTPNEKDTGTMESFLADHFAQRPRGSDFLTLPPHIIQGVAGQLSVQDAGEFRLATPALNSAAMTGTTIVHVSRPACDTSRSGLRRTRADRIRLDRKCERCFPAQRSVAATAHLRRCPAAGPTRPGVRAVYCVGGTSWYLECRYPIHAVREPDPGSASAATTCHAYGSVR